MTNKSVMTINCVNIISIYRDGYSKFNHSMRASIISALKDFLLTKHIALSMLGYRYTPYNAECDVRPCTAMSSGNSSQQPRCNIAEHPTFHRGGGGGADRPLCRESSAV